MKRRCVVPECTATEMYGRQFCRKHYLIALRVAKKFSKQTRAPLPVKVP